jgi:hypothetical protein
MKASGAFVEGLPVLRSGATPAIVDKMLALI